MDFFNRKELTDDEKANLTEWMKVQLTEAMGDSCDAVFLEYVMVMVINGKTMAEIGADLEAFIGKPACTEFSKRFIELNLTKSFIIS